MNATEIQEILNKITYKPGWSIIFERNKNGRPFIQIQVDDTLDAKTKKITYWKSGKRYLSTFMCSQEIVGVAFDLIKGAEDHEMREWFRYKGAAIYNAHLDPDALFEVARKKKNFVVRQNSMSMEEN